MYNIFLHGGESHQGEVGGGDGASSHGDVQV
jgi:hypothetical protein